jgi:hypothetical protein
MGQIQGFSPAAKESLETGHKRTGDPDFDVVGIGFSCGILSGVPTGNGIEIRFKQHRSVPADGGISTHGNKRSVMRKRLQTLPVLLQLNVYRSRTAVNLAVQIVDAFFQQFYTYLLQLFTLGSGTHTLRRI